MITSGDLKWTVINLAIFGAEMAVGGGVWIHLLWREWEARERRKEERRAGRVR